MKKLKQPDIQLFENQFPGHDIYLPKIIANSKLLDYTGRLNYIVTASGDLIAGKKGNFPGGGHLDIAMGKPIQAAGEFKIVDGNVKYIDNSSGHYLPKGLTAQIAAEKAFRDIGLDPVGKYIEKYWLEELSMQNGGVWKKIK